MDASQMRKYNMPFGASELARPSYTLTARRPDGRFEKEDLRCSYVDYRWKSGPKGRGWLTTHTKFFAGAQLPGHCLEGAKRGKNDELNQLDELLRQREAPTTLYNTDIVTVEDKQLLRDLLSIVAGEALRLRASSSMPTSEPRFKAKPLSTSTETNSRRSSLRRDTTLGGRVVPKRKSPDLKPLTEEEALELLNRYGKSVAHPNPATSFLDGSQTSPQLSKQPLNRTQPVSIAQAGRTSPNALKRMSFTCLNDQPNELLSSYRNQVSPCIEHPSSVPSAAPSPSGTWSSTGDTLHSGSTFPLGQGITAFSPYGTVAEHLDAPTSPWSGTSFSSLKSSHSPHPEHERYLDTVSISPMVAWTPYDTIPQQQLGDIPTYAPSSRPMYASSIISPSLAPVFGEEVNASFDIDAVFSIGNNSNGDRPENTVSTGTDLFDLSGTQEHGNLFQRQALGDE